MGPILHVNSDTPAKYEPNELLTPKYLSQGLYSPYIQFSEGGYRDDFDLEFLTRGAETRTMWSTIGSDRVNEEVVYERLKAVLPTGDLTLSFSPRFGVKAIHYAISAESFLWPSSGESNPSEEKILGFMLRDPRRTLPPLKKITVTPSIEPDPRVMESLQDCYDRLAEVYNTQKAELAKADADEFERRATELFGDLGLTESYNM